MLCSGKNNEIIVFFYVQAYLILLFLVEVGCAQRQNSG